MQEEPVRAVDLDDIESSPHSTLGCLRERRDDVLDVLLGKLLRNRKLRIVLHSAGRNDVVRPSAQLRARGLPEREPRCHGGRLPPRVRKLDSDLLVLGVCEGGERGKGGDLLVRPQPEVFWGDAALGSDGGRFHEGETGAAGDDAANYATSVS